jgi:hypothetical protein
MNAITNHLRRELLAAQTILVKPFPRGTRAVKSLGSSDLVDFEFSDFGRDPRFLPGWWIVPLLAPILAAIFVMTF